MVVALAGAIAMFLLGAIGFVSGDGVTQTVEVVRGIWFLYAFCPVIGAVISVIMMLILYKLRDHEINLIKKVNIGEMSREEAEASFSRRSGHFPVGRDYRCPAKFRELQGKCS